MTMDNYGCDTKEEAWPPSPETWNFEPQTIMVLCIDRRMQHLYLMTFSLSFFLKVF